MLVMSWSKRTDPSAARCSHDKMSPHNDVGKHSRLLQSEISREQRCQPSVQVNNTGLSGQVLPAETGDPAAFALSPSGVSPHACDHNQYNSKQTPWQWLLTGLHTILAGQGLLRSKSGQQ